MNQIDSIPRAKTQMFLPAPFLRWFADKGWQPRAHQLELLSRVQGGENMLLIAPTGAGKTLAGFLPSLVSLTERGKIPPGSAFTGIHTLYISPLKALAVDIERNLMKPVGDMGLPVRIENRTGDTPAAKRQRQKLNPPDILLTTPEQVALLLANGEAERFFKDLKYVVLDELHSLVTSKRGHLLSRACPLAPTGTWHAGHRPVRHRRRPDGPAALAGTPESGRKQSCRIDHGHRRRTAGNFDHADG